MTTEITTDTGRMTFHDIIKDGAPYRTTEKYTTAQQEEVRYILLRALRLSVGALRPDLVDEVDVTLSFRDNARQL